MTNRLVGAYPAPCEDLLHNLPRGLLQGSVDLGPNVGHHFLTISKNDSKWDN